MDIKPEQRKSLIAALLNGNIQAVDEIHKEISGEKVIIHNFFEHLKFTNTIGRKWEDFKKIVIAPGEYRNALMRVGDQVDDEGNLINPFISVKCLTDEEIEQITEQAKYCKQQ